MAANSTGPLPDARDKAMRIAYAYSQNQQSAAELVQCMIDSAVQDRNAELLEALEALTEVVVGLQVGSIWSRHNINVVRARRQAEAAIRKARGQ